MEGNFFEDLTLGRRFEHGTPRTIGEAETVLYIALTGSRQPLNSSRPLAHAMGLPDRPIDDGLVFNMVFGKTVPDLSLNAVANLGYADVRFLAPVYPGDTLSVLSEVIGRREASSGNAGVVYVRSDAVNQNQVPVLSYVRWVLVHKERPEVPDTITLIPELPDRVDVERMRRPHVSSSRQIVEATGSPKLWADYSIGERIEHPSGMTIDASDHTLATKLYQNNAKVHFDAHAMRTTAAGERLVYGGHVISVCRALSYDGLENILAIAAINGGTHTTPTYASDTIYSASEVLDSFQISDEIGALRLRLWGLKNARPRELELEVTGEKSFSRHPAVVLDLDYTVFIPI